MRTGAVRPLARLAACAGLLLMAAAAPVLSQPLAHAALEPVPFAELEGWSSDDHAAAFAAFRVSCRAIAEGSPALRAAAAPPPAFIPICRRALEVSAWSDAAATRAFFEQHFEPMRVRPHNGQGFLTGYFEPEIAGARAPSSDFNAPVLARPDDLVTLGPGDERGNLDPALAAARRTPAGLEPFPDRAAILDGALAGQGLERLYLRDRVELFIVQVQGSARVRLDDGRLMRLTYSGRNGHPYTSIGRILIDEGRIAAADMSLEILMDWLRAHPAEADAVMRRNRSYVFFEVSESIDPARGPIGGAGVPLTPGRSLAVDRSLWAYGLPVFVGADIATLGQSAGRLRRLTVAQDTGSAIVGPARADFFWGSGTEAGRLAGLTRHRLDFVVLWPKQGPVP